MNENSFGGLQNRIQLKAFTILSGSAGFPGGYSTSPVFFGFWKKCSDPGSDKMIGLTYEFRSLA